MTATNDAQQFNRVVSLVTIPMRHAGRARAAVTKSVRPAVAAGATVPPPAAKAGINHRI
jgi:hypothetical protein